MDGSAFRHLSFGWLIPVFVLACVGALALGAAFAWGLFWIATHISFTVT